MGLLSADDVSYMRECLDEVGSDIEQPITYRRFVENIPGDPILGIPESMITTDFSISGRVRALSLEEIQVSGGAYILGDIEVKIRKTALAEHPQYTDRIIYSGDTFKPKSITSSYLGENLIWIIKAGAK